MERQDQDQPTKKGGQQQAPKREQKQPATPQPAGQQGNISTLDQGQDRD